MTSVRFRGQDDMIRHLGQYRQLGLRILCALAFLLLGFAHKPPVVDVGPIPASEIAAYILPDGTLPVLCLPSEVGTAKQDHHESGNFCEACRLAASTILPTPVDTLGAPIPREIAHVASQGRDLARPSTSSSGTSARGPPLPILT